MKTPEATSVALTAAFMTKQSALSLTVWTYTCKKDFIGDEVLALPLGGGELIPLDAWRRVGTSRQTADVHALRELGCPDDQVNAISTASIADASCEKNPRTSQATTSQACKEAGHIDGGLKGWK